MMLVDLPFPPRILHPNSRPHWAAKAKAAKHARSDAAIVARAAGVRKIQADRLNITVIFSPPNRRRRDTDGMLSACKSYFDGIADAIGVDDSRWDIAIRRGEPVKGGNVRIEIEVSK